MEKKKKSSVGEFERVNIVDRDVNKGWALRAGSSSTLKFLGLGLKFSICGAGLVKLGGWAGWVARVVA